MIPIEATRTETQVEKFTSVRAQTEAFCKHMTTEDYVPQPDLFVSPPKWHLAHTTWFFEEFILKPYFENYTEFDPEFSFLFNSYYNHVGKRTQRHERGLMTRPSVEQVYKYRAYVNTKIAELLKEEPNEKVCELLEVGLNHEQQHQELLITDFKYTLSLNPIHPVYHESINLVNKKEIHTNTFAKIEEGVYEIGHQEPGFSFDNELGVHKVYIHEFEISKDLISNKEYIEFINAGAYDEFEFWLDEGWAWVNSNKVKAPLYWEEKEGKWYNFTLAGQKEVDLEAPVVHISFYEANAFANWKKMRLPTEFEWEVASNQFEWGKRWEWTNSAYLPYPGFQIAEGALGEYNGKFMVNQMVLRGASVATSEKHSRATYRNFFHPHSQWQFSGIRLVKL